MTPWIHLYSPATSFEASLCISNFPRRQLEKQLSSKMASDTSYTVPLLINGKEVTTKTTFAVTSPSSHKKIWESSSASLDDARNAAAAAQAAFPAWAKMKPAAKRDIFMKAADIIDSRKDELADYMKVETGAAEAFSNGFNVPKCADMLRDVAGRLSTIMGHIPSCEAEGTAALILKEPLGVVLAIAPWYVAGSSFSQLHELIYPQERTLRAGYALNSVSSCRRQYCRLQGVSSFAFNRH